MLDDLGVFQEHVDIYCDNLRAIKLVKKQIYRSRTKHIDDRFHFIREILDEGNILLKKIGTVDSPADMLTMMVFGVKFHHCKDLTNILQV